MSKPYKTEQQSGSFLSCLFSIVHLFAGRIMLTVRSLYAHKCSQTLQIPSNTRQMAKNNTDASWALLICSWNCQNRLNSFKIIQNPVNFLHLTPDGYLTECFFTKSNPSNSFYELKILKKHKF